MVIESVTKFGLSDWL